MSDRSSQQSRAHGCEGAGYPVVLDVRGRPCLVVGAGAVAARKVAGLVGAGAEVTVVAPRVHPTIAALADDQGVATRSGAGTVAIERRPYRAGDAARFRLVVTATGLPEVDDLVVADAEAAGVWLNCADDPGRSSFLLPSVHRDGPVSVAVSTGGASPALAGWLRRRLGNAAGRHVGELATLLADGRRRIQAQRRPTSAVDWQALLDGPLPDLVADGRIEEARAIVDRATAPEGRDAPPEDLARAPERGGAAPAHGA